MNNKELIDRLDTMLIRTIADIDNEWGGQEIGEDKKDEIREAYDQMKKLIQQSGEKPDDSLTPRLEYDDDGNVVQLGTSGGTENPEIDDSLLDDIIDAVLEYARRRYRIRIGFGIDDEKKVKEKLNKILKGGK